MTDVFEKHPRPWRVNEHLVGRRNGACVIEDAGEAPIAKMWHDTDGDIARAIVEAVNATILPGDPDAPSVCPGCHAVNERCRPGCIDDEMRRAREDEHDYGPRDEREGDDDA